MSGINDIDVQNFFKNMKSIVQETTQTDSHTSRIAKSLDQCDCGCGDDCCGGKSDECNCGKDDVSTLCIGHVDASDNIVLTDTPEVSSVDDINETTPVCDGCGKHCPLTSPSCSVGESKVKCTTGVSEKLTKTVNDEEGKTRTNVIYLNTDCNLRCEYCYEGGSREGLPDQENCTPESIIKFMDSVYSREKERNTCIVLMGGEPFLRFDLIECAVNYAIKTQKPGGTSFSLITNGTFLTPEKTKELHTLMTRANQNNVTISLEISFDGSGQYRRKFPDGSNSAELVEKGIRELMKHNIHFEISYTTHVGNYKTVLEDMIYIIKNYRSHVSAITCGIAYNDLDKIEDRAGFKLKEHYRPYLEYLFDIYGIPICGAVCGYCGYCDRKNCVGNSYLSPTTGVSYADKFIEREFKQF